MDIWSQVSQIYIWNLGFARTLYAVSIRLFYTVLILVLQNNTSKRDTCSWLHMYIKWKSFPHNDVHYWTTTIQSNGNLNIWVHETRSFINIRMVHNFHIFQTRWLHFLLWYHNSLKKHIQIVILFKLYYNWCVTQ